MTSGSSLRELYCAYVNVKRRGYPDDLLIIASRRGYEVLYQDLVENEPRIRPNEYEFLYTAARYGQINIIDCVIHRGSTTLKQNGSALVLALEHGHVDIARYLIFHVAAINMYKPLQVASSRGNLEIVKLLVEHGAIIDAGENLALRNAAKHKHYSIVNTYVVKH